MNERTRGLALAGHKTESVAGPIPAAPAPACAVMPLLQHIGAPAVPCVRAGDRVLIGSPIAAAADGLSAGLHAQVAGRVRTLEPRPYPGTAPALVPAVVIENDGSEAHADPVLVPGTALTLGPDALRAAIRAAGIVGLGGAAFPTDVKLAPGADRPVSLLVINGAECEPYISCDQAMLTHHAGEVVLGARIMMHALTAERCVIAIESDKARAIEAVAAHLRELRDARIALRLVQPVYPAGAERGLITLLTGKEVPAGGIPADVGVVCQNVGTALAVARLDTTGEPLTRRVVTVAGSGVANPANFDVPLGTSFGAVIAAAGGYTELATELIMGGTMMGIALDHDEVPVIKATNCILAAGPREVTRRAAELPCIRCGECAVVCPAFLLPQQLHRQARERNVDALAAFGLTDCIECGCCDHVCPSRIRLTARFRSAKEWLFEREEARQRATHAKQRFDARTARIDREAREQAARQAEQLRKARQLVGERTGRADHDP
jgi:electron transport complex protein RnfC